MPSYQFHTTTTGKTLRIRPDGADFEIYEGKTGCVLVRLVADEAYAKQYRIKHGCRLSHRLWLAEARAAVRAWADILVGA
jgi:hypothetical protein